MLNDNLTETLLDALEAQAKLTAYYNGQGIIVNIDKKESLNHWGRAQWWDYLTDDARALLIKWRYNYCCTRHNDG